MTEDERRFLQQQLEEKYRWFNTGSRAWSFAFNGSALVRDELCKVLESHDQAIIGNPVK